VIGQAIYGTRLLSATKLCIKVTGQSKLELTYCAKHNQHAKHAKAREVWGHAPPGKF